MRYYILLFTVFATTCLAMNQQFLALEEKQSQECNFTDSEVAEQIKKNCLEYVLSHVDRYLAKPAKSDTSLSNPVTAIAVHPTISEVFIGCKDGRIRLSNPFFSPLDFVSCHPDDLCNDIKRGPIVSLQCNKNGSHLAAQCGNNNLMVLEHGAWQPVAHIISRQMFPKGFITCMAWKDNNNVLIAVHDETGNVIEMSPIDKPGSILVQNSKNEFIKCIACHPDSTKMMYGSNHGTITIFDFNTNRPVQVIQGNMQCIIPITYLTYTPNGQQFASCNANEVVQIWNCEDGKKIAQCRISIVQQQSLIAYSPDNHYFARTENNNICIYDVTNIYDTNNETPQFLSDITQILIPQMIIPISFDRISSLIWANNNQLIGGTTEGHLYMWKIASLLEMRKYIRNASLPVLQVLQKLYKMHEEDSLAQLNDHEQEIIDTIPESIKTILLQTTEKKPAQSSSRCCIQ